MCLVCFVWGVCVLIEWKGMSLTGGTKTTKEMAGQPGPTEVHGGWDLTKEKALDLERVCIL